MTYEDLKGEYARLLASMEIRQSKLADIHATAMKIVAKKSRYAAVMKETGVPWHVVGLIHAMEAGCNFNCHLHNGDPLTARTRQVPKGRPTQGDPPFAWKDSAVDALRFDGLDKIKEWPLERVCYELEKFNGWGYRIRKTNIQTPYLWSGSNHYAQGKFVQDGVFSPTVVSGQSGAMPILERMIVIDPSIKSDGEIAQPEEHEEVVAEAAMAFPRADPSAPNIVSVAAKSKTVWTLVSAGALKIVDTFTDSLHQVWDGLLWTMGLLPSVATDVQGQVESTEKLSGWLQFDKATAGGIVSVIVIVAIVIAIIRHANDKKALTP